MSEPVKVGPVRFRFECQPGCTNCCTQDGHVYLTEEDIARIARHLGMSSAAFERQYVTRQEDLPRLKMALRERCFFLQPYGCGIHVVKPLQCRVFPYWPEHVASKAAWSRLRKFCPGVGVGPLVQITSVRKEAEAYRQAFPGL